MNGLNDGLAYALESRDFHKFQAMVDKALVLENRRGIMEKKRKLQQGSSGSKQPRVGSSSAESTFRPVQQNGHPRTQFTGQVVNTLQRPVQRPNP